MTQCVTPSLRRGCVARRGLVAAFSMVELLVVSAIIVLLMGILLPSLRKAIRQARSTVCKSNLKNLHHALMIYQDENHGWLPAMDQTSAFRSTEAWSARLYEEHPAGKSVLICPDDPWGAIMRNNMDLGTLDVGAHISYGLNDFIVSSPDSFLANLARYQPLRPGDTILLADMGPDTVSTPSGENGSGNEEEFIQLPSRNFGRLSIDDGYRPGTPPEERTEPWLTGRHMGKINVLTLVGNVKEVGTGLVFQRAVESYYPNCAAQTCTICLDLLLPHYSFAESQAFWWTGPAPRR